RRQGDPMSTEDPYSAPTGQPQPPNWEQQPSYQAPAGPVQPATLGPRFLAKLIDWILLGIVVNGIIVTTFIVRAMGDDSVFSTSIGYGTLLLATLVTTALYLAYFVLMESSRGQTVGKMLLKLQVQGPSGGLPTMEEALRRNGYMALGLLGIIPSIGGTLGSL